VSEIIQRVVRNLIGRIYGPFTFRFVLQPLVAVILGFRAGLRDAHARRPSYFYSLLFHRGHRREMVLDTVRDLAKLFVVAVLLDTIYQIIELHWIYPGEALIVAQVLSIVPYMLVRESVGRITQWWYRKRRHGIRAAAS
jgi:hypothetical protein